MAKTDNKNAKKVPGALVAAVVVVIAIAAFVPTVYMPYKNKKPEMDAKHQEALDSIAYLDESIANQADIEAEIEDLKAQWEKFQKDMFVDSNSALADLNDAIKECDIDLTGYSAGDPAPDPSGTVTAEGNPLYYTSISISGQSTREKLLDFLKYVEEDSIGAYYVKTLSAAPVDILDSDGKATGEQELSYQMQIFLYYFNQDIVIEPEVVETDSDSAS